MAHHVFCGPVHAWSLPGPCHCLFPSVPPPNSFLRFPEFTEPLDIIAIVSVPGCCDSEQEVCIGLSPRACIVDFTGSLARLVFTADVVRGYFSLLCLSSWCCVLFVVHEGIREMENQTFLASLYVHSSFRGSHAFIHWSRHPSRVLLHPPFPAVRRCAPTIPRTATNRKPRRRRELSIRTRCHSALRNDTITHVSSSNRTLRKRSRNSWNRELSVPLFLGLPSRALCTSGSLRRWVIAGWGCRQGRARRTCPHAPARGAGHRGPRGRSAESVTVFLAS